MCRVRSPAGVKKVHSACHYTCFIPFIIHGALEQESSYCLSLHMFYTILHYTWCAGTGKFILLVITHVLYHSSLYKVHWSRKVHTACHYTCFIPFFNIHGALEQESSYCLSLHMFYTILHYTRCTGAGKFILLVITHVLYHSSIYMVRWNRKVHTACHYTCFIPFFIIQGALE